MEKVILYGETHSEITEMLVDKIKNTNGEEKDRAMRIYKNWMDFVKTLQPIGLCGLTSV